MLKYARNKLVSIAREDEDRFLVHGILDDDIYGLEIDVVIRISNLEILSIEGKWNRWTTPECRRAIPLLQEAVGWYIDESFSGRVKKIIRRRSCRQFASILLECAHSAKSAASLIKWEDEKAGRPGLSFEEFLSESPGNEPGLTETPHVTTEEVPGQKEQTEDRAKQEKTSGGMVIDLHVHTSPASPCSSAPVDELVEEAKRIGLDGICLTDHNYAWDPEKIEELREKHDFLILRGNEITTDQGDMVVFGLDRDIKGIISLEELREEVLESDGFMIVAHPFRGFQIFGVGQLGLTPEKAMERPLLKLVDAVEVMNSKVTEKENSFAQKVAEGLKIPMTGGSDAHEVSEAGIYATRFSVVIHDENDLIEALKGGDYSPVAFRPQRPLRLGGDGKGGA